MPGGNKQAISGQVENQESISSIQNGEDVLKDNEIDEICESIEIDEILREDALVKDSPELQDLKTTEDNEQTETEHDENQLEEISDDFLEQSIPEEDYGEIATGAEEELQPTVKSKKKKSMLKRILLRAGMCLMTFIIIIVVGFFSAVAVINYGPSVHARDLFVVSMMETSAAKFLATWYFSGDKVKEILANNTVVPSEETTDTGLVNIDKETNPKFDKNKIEVVSVSGDTYKGQMMIINDPSRLFVGTSGVYGKEMKGKPLIDMVKENKAIAGINAGGFEDANGEGNGGTPTGIVISKGELKYGNLTATYDLMGFDKDNRLIVGKMTGQEAVSKGLRDAVFFGPSLIINGVPSEVKGTGGGLNPRTAIGQRADGAILLLVVDGRQANSIGALYQDLIAELIKFGAVNAYNLDGGSSSELIYQGKRISTCASLYGARPLPTSILVRGE